MAISSEYEYVLLVASSVIIQVNFLFVHKDKRQRIDSL
jgi:hypothetical protein